MTEIRTEHQLRPLGLVEVFGEEWELERESHHHGKTYAKCEADAPITYQVAPYHVVQEARNQDPDYFNLRNDWIFVQNPDKISREKGFVAAFFAYPDRAGLGCDGDASDFYASLGVRYARKNSPKEPDPDKDIDPDGKGDYRMGDR